MSRYKVYNNERIVFETDNFIEAETSYKRLKSLNKTLTVDGGVEIARVQSVPPPDFVYVYLLDDDLQVPINGFKDRDRLLLAAESGNEKVYEVLKSLVKLDSQDIIESVQVEMFNDPFGDSSVEIWKKGEVK